jgi:hypothetical protein
LCARVEVEQVQRTRIAADCNQRFGRDGSTHRQTPNALYT